MKNIKIITVICLNVLLLSTISNADVLHAQLKKPIEKSSTLYNQLAFTNQNSQTNSPDKRKTAIGRWAKKHRAELAFTAVAAGTGIAGLALNSKVKDLKVEEEKLYKAYLDLNGLNHDELWSEYEKAHDETVKYARMRNGFYIATGGIGIALVMSIYIGGQ